MPGEGEFFSPRVLPAQDLPDLLDTALVRSRFVGVELLSCVRLFCDPMD